MLSVFFIAKNRDSSPNEYMGEVKKHLKKEGKFYGRSF